MKSLVTWQRLGMICVTAAVCIATAAAAPTLTLDTPVLTENGQLVTVTWSGIPLGDSKDPGNPIVADTIALVSAAGPFGSTYPIKYVWVEQAAPKTYLQGTGSAR